MGICVWLKRHFLFTDCALTVLACLAVWVSSLKIDTIARILTLDANTRTDLYSIAATVSGSLLGFVVTGITILLALTDHKKLDYLRQSPYYRQVYAVFLHGIYALALATALSIVGLVYDRSSTANPWIFWPNLWAAIFVASRMYRCVWILENIIAIVTQKNPHHTDTIN